VSEALAREFFPNESAVGHRIQIEQGEPEPAEIVGIVKTMKYETLRETPHDIVFEPYGQGLDDAGAADLEVRGATGLGGLTAAVQGRRRGDCRAVSRCDPDAQRRGESIFHRGTDSPPFWAAALGYLAMLLAPVGL